MEVEKDAHIRTAEKVLILQATNAKNMEEVVDAPCAENQQDDQVINVHYMEEAPDVMFLDAQLQPDQDIKHANIMVRNVVNILVVAQKVLVLRINFV
jgi:hypothetical protein